MKKVLLHWILSALAIWVVSQVVDGFSVDSAGAALIAAVVIGFVNGTFGLVLKIMTLPLSIMTFGLFLFVINAIMILMSSAIIPGFHVDGFLSAFVGGIVLAVVSTFFRILAGSK